jgi:protein SCO1/2
LRQAFATGEKMKRLTTLLAVKLLLLATALYASACLAQAVPIKTFGATLPGDSVYQVPALMTDHDGRTFKLADRRGKPMLISMFYNSCQFVCPMLIDTIRRTEQSLTPEERATFSIMLITFDPVRDNVKMLKSVTKIHALDPSRWTLALTDSANVRKIAAALDIQYRLLDNGEYNHTTVLVLLDADGRIIGRSKKLGAVDPVFLGLIQQAVKGGKPKGS